MAQKTDDLVEHEWGKDPVPVREKNLSGLGSAIAGAVANSIFAGILVAVGGWSLPFLTPAWALVLPALLFERLMAAVGGFMGIGRDNRFGRGIGKILEHGAGAWASWMLWKNYPFDFAALGLPPGVDQWLPWAFALFAGIHVLGGITSFFRMFSKKGDKWNKHRKNSSEDGDAVS